MRQERFDHLRAFLGLRWPASAHHQRPSDTPRPGSSLEDGGSAPFHVLRFNLLRFVACYDPGMLRLRWVPAPFMAVCLLSFLPLFILSDATMRLHIANLLGHSASRFLGAQDRRPGFCPTLSEWDDTLTGQDKHYGVSGSNRCECQTYE